LAFDAIDDREWKPSHEPPARVPRTGTAGLGKGFRQRYSAVDLLGELDSKSNPARLVIGNRPVEFGLGEAA
jgi:hypothetical protein